MPWLCAASPIITTGANTLIADIHNRKLIILEQSDWPVWPAETEGNVPALFHPAPDEILRTWPVGRQVNAPRYDGPGLLEPIS
jgi:putative SOS response-associated peptidase YedK